MCGMRKLRTLDIVDYVKAKKRCTLAHLMQKFKVSSAKIHRALQIKLKDGISAPRAFDDYDISLAEIDGVKPEIIDLM